MARPIKEEERALIAYLLTKVKDGQRYAIPDDVESLGEAGIQFTQKGEHAADLVEAEYTDSDGRAVFITLTANDAGALYELDLWKVDFSRLQSYPTPGEIRFEE
ncbi:hypothetical protein EPD60_03255 [Flaviaesturariibacter flavus]|uniref:DUF6984 domain-containing protein n=1 Tax=Flaviaesturariibacter flavus TaxID=2502780 RepID=A0A4R1BMS0_9BACT|nr:hypothetical protein [Flaviaesturariibacter flavus]TCJ18791.1 hypothetical protein EPD60_03255 [Flaviaesturariibacter flavus]